MVDLKDRIEGMGPIVSFWEYDTSAGIPDYLKLKDGTVVSAKKVVNAIMTQATAEPVCLEDDPSKLRLFFKVKDRDVAYECSFFGNTAGEPYTQFEVSKDYLVNQLHVVGRALPRDPMPLEDFFKRLLRRRVNPGHYTIFDL